MTTNLVYLHEALSKRIANGNVTSRDLSLLNQLLSCQQRRWLMVGAALGISAASAAFGIAYLTL